MTELPDAVAATYDSYLAAVNEPDPEIRIAILRRCTADDVTIVSPGYVVAGRGDVGRKLGDVMAALEVPVRMERTTAIDRHHGILRAGWRGVSGEGKVEVRGEHVCELRGSKIARILVFVGAPDAPPDASPVRPRSRRRDLLRRLWRRRSRPRPTRAPDGVVVVPEGESLMAVHLPREKPATEPD